MRWHPSPNFGLRRDGLGVEHIVIHYTAMDDSDRAIRWLCDPVSQVSAHYLIDRSGRITHMVKEDCRAWHAGAGMWRGQGDLNSRSIGIELCNTGSDAFPRDQMAALMALLEGLIGRWHLKPSDVIAHSDLAPARKIDPGRLFDWRMLADRGLSVWPMQVVGTKTDFGQNLKKFGYCWQGLPDVPSAVLNAMRLRFRPNINPDAQMPADQVDFDIAAGLAQLAQPT